MVQKINFKLMTLMGALAATLVAQPSNFNTTPAVINPTASLQPPSGGNFFSDRPRIAGHGDTVICVYNERRINQTGNSDIFWLSSADGGESWVQGGSFGSDLIYTGGQWGDGSQEVTVSSSGTIVVTWDNRELNAPLTDFDVFALRGQILPSGAVLWDLTPSGQPNVQRLSRFADPAQSFDRLPAVATNDQGDWIIGWESTDSNAQGLGPDKDILIVTSNDDGASWSTAFALEGFAATMDSDNENDFEIEYDATTGQWVALFSSTRLVGNPNLFVSTATNPASWSIPTQLETNLAAAPGEDMDSDLVVTPEGWFAAWRTRSRTIAGQFSGNDSDIVFSRKLSGSATWEPARFLAPVQALNDNGHDAYRPRLSPDGFGNWLVSWTSLNPGILPGAGTDPDIVYVFSFDGTDTFSGVHAPYSLGSDPAAQVDETPDVYAYGQATWRLLWQAKDFLFHLPGSGYQDNDIVSCRIQPRLPASRPGTSHDLYLRSAVGSFADLPALSRGDRLDRKELTGRQLLDMEVFSYYAGGDFAFQPLFLFAEAGPTQSAPFMPPFALAPWLHVNFLTGGAIDLLAIAPPLGGSLFLPGTTRVSYTLAGLPPAATGNSFLVQALLLGPNGIVASDAHEFTF